MVKRVKAGLLDESLIIQSFKDADLVVDPADAVLRKEERVTPEPPPVQAEPETTDTVPAPEGGDTAGKSKPRRRRGNYDEVFLRRKEIKTRQPVYISQQIHRSVTKLVHLLALTGHEISVGGYIDNVLSEHFRQHKEEIAGLCRDKMDDFL